MGVKNGIDEKTWAMMNMVVLLKELRIQRASRDRIVQMRNNFAAKGINVTSTKLQGKSADFDALVAKMNEVVDGPEMTWLENNTYESVSPDKLY